MSGFIVKLAVVFLILGVTGCAEDEPLQSANPMKVALESNRAEAPSIDVAPVPAFGHSNSYYAAPRFFPPIGGGLPRR